MTDEQLEAAATIQAIAEEMNACDKRWAAGKLRRQGRRLLEALDRLTQEVRPPAAAGGDLTT
jgi:hypothetical protein